MRLILFFSGTSILTGCIDSYPTSPNKKFVDLPSEDFDGDLYSENDGDLDDNDPTVYPNAEELCDGKDNDQDGEIDEGPENHNEYYTDFDQDGFGDNTTRYTACFPENSLDILVTSNKNDCDDNNDAINPQAYELCDGVDNNCDGETDEDAAVNALAWYNDADGDGFGVDEALPSRACTQPDGYSNFNTDCDDSNPEIFLGALEYCNDADDDCDGEIDEGENNAAPVDAPMWYLDSDNDGYGFQQASIRVCTVPEGYVSNDIDCNDSDSTFHPEATEFCNGLDEDCDEEIDEDAQDATTYYADQDSDGFGDPLNTTQNCSLPVGFVSDNTDCNDQSANISPESDEYCNGVDEDCDEEIDEEALDRITYYADQDGDTFGDPNLSELLCQLSEGFVPNGFDCDDSNEMHYPGADEYCDEIDNNCDGVVDENAAVDANTYYQDLDNDNYGLTEIFFQACNEPSGYSELDGDCDDNDPLQRPEITELCNGEDDDCDGLSDESPSEDPDSPAIGLQTFYLDVDGDGHGSLESATDQSLQIQSCPQLGQIAPEGYAFVADDCDDDDVSISPSLIENCDEIDRNCDGDSILGAIDILRWYVDSDGDGFGNPDISFDSCLAPVGFIAQAGDCDDLDTLSNPEAVERCNGKLDDCDSTVELLDGRPLDESDEDGDGHVECELDVDVSVWEGQEGIVGGLDCDDTRSNSYPGSTIDAWISECMFDSDDDGYGDTDPPVGFDVGTDCDDDNATRYHSAPELCNGTYDNCEDFLLYPDGIPEKEFDDDGDGFVECEGRSVDWFGQDDIIGDGDCDDTDEFTYPGAAALTSETECLRDATGSGGIGGPDGYADCRYGDCAYSYIQDLEKGIAMDFVKVTRGEELDHDFYMMSTEITMGSYTALAGQDPHSQCGGMEYDLENNLQKPANRMSQSQARLTANILSEEKGFETCYDCTGSGTGADCSLKEEFESIHDCDGYHLPTDLQIKRAGSLHSSNTSGFATASGLGNYTINSCDEESFLTDSGSTPLSSIAWYCFNSGGEVHDVAQLNPTAFGLFDIFGNLIEITENGRSIYGLFSSAPDYLRMYRNGGIDNRCNYNAYMHTYRLVRNVEDSAPTKPVLTLVPEKPVVDETDLICDVTQPSIDPNGLEIYYTFSFYVDDVLYEGETSTTNFEGDTVPSQFLTEKQNWTCEVTPSDGNLEGETAVSDNYVEPYIRGTCVNFDCDYGVMLDAREDYGFDFKEIPAGTDPLGRYELTYDFYMQVFHPATEEFVYLAGYRPRSLCGISSSYERSEVALLSWHQMARFTNAVSEQEGLESCYDCQNSVLDVECQTASAFTTDGIHTCEGYRLPTHAELEYAQRAGTDKHFWTPNGGGDLLGSQYTAANIPLDIGVYLQDYVYCERNELDFSERLPNGFGIRDINGLRYDMAHDSAGCSYPNGYTNPVCDDSISEAHIQVGGYLYDYAIGVINGDYSEEIPSCNTKDHSFRMVRSIIED